jgi:hypothetical protein
MTHSFRTLFLVCALGGTAAAAHAADARWHLERDGPGVKMTAHLERRVVSLGNPIDTIAATPTPPTLPWQNQIVTRMTFNGVPVGAPIIEGSVHKRRISLAQSDQKTSVTIGTDITAMVYRYKIVLGPPKVAAPDLSKKERAEALAPVGNLDYRGAAFQAYVKQRGLLWRRTHHESLDEFIQRAAAQVKHDFTYYEGDQDRHVATLVATCKGDCGAINGVFTAVMRQNGVPAHLWAGFRRLPTMPAAWQPHVVASVFVPKVGWFPVDLVSGDLMVYSMAGENNAIFVTHIDDGFVLHPKGWDTLRPDWMQPTAFYYRGGPLVSGLDVVADIKFGDTARR